MSLGRRLASAATLVIPAGLILVLLIGFSQTPQNSGAGLSEENRPIMVFVLAAFGAIGWFFATSILYAVHRPAEELPNTARAYAFPFIYGSSTAPDLTRPARSTVPVRQLVVIAVFWLPLWTFIAPMDIGLWAHGGVWKQEEAAAVAVMAISILSWTVFLTGRARARW